MFAERKLGELPSLPDEKRFQATCRNVNLIRPKPLAEGESGGTQASPEFLELEKQFDQKLAKIPTDDRSEKIRICEVNSRCFKLHRYSYNSLNYRQILL